VEVDTRHGVSFLAAMPLNMPSWGAATGSATHGTLEELIRSLTIYVGGTGTTA
jgi:hypothetical protein